MIATIKNKKEIAAGTLLVDFELKNRISFQAGQYFFITLIDPPYTDAKGSVRHFTIVNSPNQPEIITMATRISETAFKKSLKELPIGTEVEIGEIKGNFVLPEDSKKPFVFIAGGIGITPFISMLRYINEEKLNYKITLLYSNRNQESTAFFDELKDLAKKNKKLKVIFTMTDDPVWTGEKRRIDQDLIKNQVANYQSSVYLIAGPPAMVEATKQQLSTIGITDNNVMIENFFGY
jgi:ferredoxin-NADP reductase